MRFARCLLPIILAACGGSDSKTTDDLSVGVDLESPVDVVDMSGPPYAFDLGALPTGANTVPIVLDKGPTGASGVFNTPYVSITLCPPGSTTGCTTIDHILLDTGSVGLRLVSSVVPDALRTALPPAQDSSGSPIVECYVYGNGYSWGGIHSADVTLGSVTMPSLKLEIVGEAAFPTVPTDCSSQAAVKNTVNAFNANGIIGIGPYNTDCGDFCAAVPSGSTGLFYYSCPTAGTCTPVNVAMPEQVLNPIGAMATNNNGFIVELPDPGDTPQATLDGTLVLGLGTTANNALGNATTFGLGKTNYMSIDGAILDGKTADYVVLDSGSNTNIFDDSMLEACTGEFSGFYCPADVTTVTAETIDSSGGMHEIAFRVGSPETEYSASSYVYKDLSLVANYKGQEVILGVPFFFGRKVFFGIEHVTQPSGVPDGPFVGY